MNRYFLLTLVVCVLCGSNAFAQGFLEQLGRELRGQIQQELQPQQQSPPRQGGGQPQGFSMPSESGRDSGGDGRFINPGQEFALPGNVQPIQPGFPGGSDQFVRPGYPGGQVIQPGGQNIYPGGRVIYPPLNQTIYTENQTRFPGQPNGMMIQPAQTNYSAGDLPGSPVLTSQYIVIRCPESTQGSVYYLLSSDKGRFGFTMTGGKEQRFKAGTNWTIGYNDGGTEKRYQLRGGNTYTIKRESDNRWKLYVTKAAGS